MSPAKAKKKLVLDDLDLSVNRKHILLAGSEGSGKSHAVGALVNDAVEQDFKVFCIDRDRGLTAVFNEVVNQDADWKAHFDYLILREWDDAVLAANHAFETLGPNDWLVIEHCGRMWDLTQTDYTKMVYGETRAERLKILRTEAETIIRENDLTGKDKNKAQANASFSGLDGRKDWSIVKADHNDDFMDRFQLEADFNVLMTTSVTSLQMGGDRALKEWSDWKTLGVKPEGEKHNRYRASTVAYAYKNGVDPNTGKGEFSWRTDLGLGKGKDRGKGLVKDIDMTDIGFVRSYMEHHGEWEEEEL